MARTTFWVLFTIGFCRIVVPQLVSACTCAPPAKIADRFAAASEVFLGEVTDIKRPLLERLGVASSGGLHVVYFSVSKRLKGPVSSNVSFTSSLSGESCGLPFKKGEQYLVYVVPNAMNANRNAAQIGICTGTGEANGREEEIRRLDELTELEQRKSR